MVGNDSGLRGACDRPNEWYIRSPLPHLLFSRLEKQAVERVRCGAVVTAPHEKELSNNLSWLNFLKLIGVTIRTRTEQARIACSQACARELLPFFREGKLRLPIDRTFRMDELAGTYACIEKSQHMGKIVLIAD